MILVTGGTGSFGHAFVRWIRSFSKQEIRVLSRDEEKQRRMAALYPDVEFVLGDVRDRASVRRAMRVGPLRNVSQVFHAAALKQVPQAEANPREYVLTNIEGTDNVCREAQEAGARVVLLSTDKAVLPVGVMGASKMLAEAVCTSYGFNAVRYGNVVGSRGSIIPLFRDQIAKGQPVTITDPSMTRFLITLDEAIGLVTVAMTEEPTGSVYVRKSPAATVEQIVRVMTAGPTKVIGIRPGEKLHEDLVAAHETAEDCGDWFKVTRNRYGGTPYTSLDAPTLTDDELRALIAQAPDDL